MPVLWLKPWFRPPEEALGFWPELAAAAAVAAAAPEEEDAAFGTFLFSFRSSMTSCYWRRLCQLLVTVSTRREQLNVQEHRLWSS